MTPERICSTTSASIILSASTRHWAIRARQVRRESYVSLRPKNRQEPVSSVSPNVQSAASSHLAGLFGSSHSGYVRSRSYHRARSTATILSGVAGADALKSGVDR